jgi:hypothetical protein
MPYLSKYHLSEHAASVLLGPIADTLAELGRRTEHYAVRVAMSPADQERMLAASRALAAAQAEITRIRDEAGSEHDPNSHIGASVR